MPGKIGFLWDSLSVNTGDQTIGLTVLRLAQRAGLGNLAPVPIGEAVVGTYDVLVIGGGELLQPASHGYYDLFRVPGAHILNTVGTGGQIDAAYLRDYRLVSVRSQADRGNLGGLEREVRVAPCLSVLFADVAEEKTKVNLPREALAVHLQPATLSPLAALRFAEILRRLPPPVLLLPFTHYNREGAVQTVLAEVAGLPPPIELRTPDQAFAIIRRLGGVVTSSLHATIMAYVAGVPFLAVPYAPKVEHFLAERGLAGRLLRDPLDLPENLHLLDPASVDWQTALAADRQAAVALAEDIWAEIARALRAGARPPRPRRGWREPTHPLQAHAAMIERHAEYGLRISELIRYEAELARVRAHANSLTEQVELQKAELTHAAEYGVALERGIAAHERDVASKEVDFNRAQANVESLSQELERTRSELARAGDYGVTLERRIADQERDLTRLTDELERSRSELGRAGDYGVTLERRIADQERDLTRLNNELERTKSELGRAAAYALTLERHIADQERELARAGDYGVTLEQRVADQERELARAGDLGVMLEQRVADQERDLAQQEVDLIALRPLSVRRRARVHALVVHHRGEQLLRHCVGGLLRSQGVTLDTLVIDNAAEEPLPQLVHNEPSVHAVRSEVPLGFAAANNLGVSWARQHLGEPDYYFFVNNDVLVQPDTLLRLVDAVEACPHGGVAGPSLAIWGAEDRLNSLGLKVTTIGEAWDEGIGRPIDEYGPIAGQHEVLAVTGSALLARAATLADVGGWSTIYGFYFEDIDLCLKARSRGWAVTHASSAWAAHAVSATSDRIPDFKRFLSWRNQLLLVLIHWPPGLLLRIAPRLVGGQLRILAQRLRVRCWADARLQARAWSSALRLLPYAWAQRRRARHTSWTRFLVPPGSVPQIELPTIPDGARPWEATAESTVSGATARNQGVG